MNRIAVFLAAGLALFGPALLGAQSAVDLSDPVATAVLPLPENLREGATVIDQATETILRQGNNGFTCLADLPGNDSAEPTVSPLHNRTIYAPRA